MSVLVSNGYPPSFIRKLTKTTRPTPNNEPTQEFKSTAVLPYIKGVSEVLSRCLQQQGVRTVFKSDTTLLYYKLDILRLFYKANNDSLPEPLMKSLLENSSHGYSLRGKELSSIPRFNSRFIKDSLRYKGSVLWNIVLYHEQQKSFSSFFDLRKHVVNRDYFKDFNFNALSASTTRHRHSDFIYN